MSPLTATRGRVAWLPSIPGTAVYFFTSCCCSCCCFCARLMSNYRPPAGHIHNNTWHLFPWFQRVLNVSISHIQFLDTYFDTRSIVCVFVLLHSQPSGLLLSQTELGKEWIRKGSSVQSLRRFVLFEQIFHERLLLSRVSWLVSMTDCEVIMITIENHPLLPTTTTTPGTIIISRRVNIPRTASRILPALIKATGSLISVGISRSLKAD